MSDWQIARHQVAIAGRVLDGHTGKPVAGALVSMTAMPPVFQKRLVITSSSRADWDEMLERPDRTRTRKDGLFYFLDLPEGSYTLSGSLPRLGKRYGAAQGSSEVSRDTKGKFKVTTITLALQPTRVKGKVVGPGQKNGVVLAEVRVKGSGERTFTDAQGQYTVAGIETGKRVLLVSAQGYQAASENVTLGEPGMAKTVNFSLTRESG